jgi:hypothetical protein
LGLGGGVTLTQSQLGQFRIDYTTAKLTLAEAGGTPLEQIGLTPGVYYGTGIVGDAITGGGNVSIGAGALTLTATPHWSGTACAGCRDDVGDAGSRTPGHDGREA